ncbi:hypothetical protein D3C77_609870 [compost metagenome]
MAAPAGAGFRAEVGQGAGDPFAGLARVQLLQVVVQQQGGVGGHQVHQGRAEGLAQAGACGQQPGHVGFVDALEQAQDEAVDGRHFDARLRGAHWASSASRMRLTAATEPGLSPCTQRVWAFSGRSLPSLARSGSPRARVRAWATTCSGSWCTAPGRLRDTR